jgi:hypothetical protein
MRTIGIAVAESEEQAVVQRWLLDRARPRSTEALLGAFEAAFTAVWQRSCLVLGDVTLSAIVERVVHVASEQHPLLGELVLEPPLLRCDRLGEAGARYDELLAGLPVVLVELLTVLGNLTAQILSPALRAAIDELVAADAAAPARQVSTP